MLPITGNQLQYRPGEIGSDYPYYNDIGKKIENLPMLGEIMSLKLETIKRAIYIGDVRFNECNVFELNYDTNNYEMLNDKEFRYTKEVVENDNEWLVFEVTRGKKEIDVIAKLANH